MQTYRFRWDPQCFGQSGSELVGGDFILGDLSAKVNNLDVYLL